MGEEHSSQQENDACQPTSSSRPLLRDELNAVVRAIDAVRFMTLVISLLVWAIVGFLFWLPMICYSVARFSSLVVYTTIVGADPNLLAVHLEHAVRFYFQGFRNILRAIYARPQVHSAEGLGFTVDWRIVVFHVVGTVIFWLLVGVLAALLRYVGAH